MSLKTLCILHCLLRRFLLRLSGAMKKTMLKAIDPNSTFSFYLPSDTDQTAKFVYRYQTAIELQEIEETIRTLHTATDDQDLMNKLGGSISKTIIEKVKFKLVEVDLKTDKLYTPDDVVNNLTRFELVSLLFAIFRHNTVSVELKKKSELPQIKSSGESVTEDVNQTSTAATSAKDQSQPDMTVPDATETDLSKKKFDALNAMALDTYS